MWLGDHNNIPHGVFHPDNELDSSTRGIRFKTIKG